MLHPLKRLYLHQFSSIKIRTNNKNFCKTSYSIASGSIPLTKK